MSHSKFIGNHGGVKKYELSMPLGVAGAVRIYSQSAVSGVALVDKTAGATRALFDNCVFEQNELVCVEYSCLAGAVGLFSTDSHFHKCRFESNRSPSLAGAIQSSGTVNSSDTEFINNAARVAFSAADVARLAVRNTTMTLLSAAHGSSTIGLNVRALQSLSQRSNTPDLTIQCPVGTQVSDSTGGGQVGGQVGGQYGCSACSNGYYNLHMAKWSGRQITDCKACPSPDPAVMTCAGSELRSQPGYFAYVEASGEVSVAACPNHEV